MAMNHRIVLTLLRQPLFTLNSFKLRPRFIGNAKKNDWPFSCANRQNIHSGKNSLNYQKILAGVKPFSVGSRSQFQLSSHCPILPQNIIARQFSTRTDGPTENLIHKKITALQTKKRPSRKKAVLPSEHDPNRASWSVVAHSTAEEYDLEALAVGLDHQALYQQSAMPEDMNDVLHVSAKYQVGQETREVYFFREGSVVFWNVPELERKSVMKFISQYENNSYKEDLISEENEMMEYLYTDNKTRLVSGTILLNSEGSTDLEKYAFSNGMALSVTLAMWEATLDRYIESIEWITENMKDGKKITMSRDNVFRKTGELFALRHLINLSSDLLDTPDFYWDRQNLENLFQKTCNHLNIAKRTKVMNEKLNHCCELMELLSNHLNDRHHVRLEWMIIVLIMVEVVFEFLHYGERFFN